MKHCEKGQQTVKSFGKVPRRSLQYNLIVNCEYESQCNISTKYIDEKKNLFYVCRANSSTCDPKKTYKPIKTKLTLKLLEAR